MPSGKEERQEHAEQVGTDGDALLSAIYADDAPGWLHEVPAVETLRGVWLQQFYFKDDAIYWRTEREGIPPTRLAINSPYDTDARLGRKRTTQWVGYKAYLTETCDDDAPRIITNVATSSATVADGALTPEVHSTLAAKRLLPHIHLADTGFLDAALLVTSKRDYGVDLVGPTRANYKWRKWTRSAERAAGFDATQFRIDWSREQVTCPEGRTSSSWTPAIDNRKNEVVKIKFATEECIRSPSSQMCTGAKRGRRMLTIRPEA